MFIEHKTASTHIGQMISSAKSHDNGEEVRATTWGGEEIHERDYPDSQLWVTICRRRSDSSPDHPAKRATRLEKDLGVTLAPVYADTLRLDVIRDYENIHKHPTPIYALVFWADTGVVYAFLPLWRYWDKDEEIYATWMPKGHPSYGGRGAYVRSRAQYPRGGGEILLQ